MGSTTHLQLGDARAELRTDAPKSKIDASCMRRALFKQGRHRYYRLAGPQVGQMLESIMNVALTGPPRFQPKSKVDDQLRRARTCYDHIAGRLGGGLAARLAEREFVILGAEAGEVTPVGQYAAGVRSNPRRSGRRRGAVRVRRIDRRRASTL